MRSPSTQLSLQSFMTGLSLLPGRASPRSDAPDDVAFLGERAPHHLEQRPGTLVEANAFGLADFLFFLGDRARMPHRRVFEGDGLAQRLHRRGNGAQLDDSLRCRRLADD